MAQPKNLDVWVEEYLNEECSRAIGTDIRLDRLARQRLKYAATKAALDLSFRNKAIVRVPYLVGGANPMHFECAVSRESFALWLKPRLEAENAVDR